jgi:hypothetical protein
MDGKFCSESCENGCNLREQCRDIEPAHVTHGIISSGFRTFLNSPEADDSSQNAIIMFNEAWYPFVVIFSD